MKLKISLLIYFLLSGISSELKKGFIHFAKLCEVFEPCRGVHSIWKSTFKNVFCRYTVLPDSSSLHRPWEEHIGHQKMCYWGWVPFCRLPSSQGKRSHSKHCLDRSSMLASRVPFEQLFFLQSWRAHASTYSSVLRSRNPVSPIEAWLPLSSYLLICVTVSWGVISSSKEAPELSGALLACILYMDLGFWVLSKAACISACGAAAVMPPALEQTTVGLRCSRHVSEWHTLCAKKRAHVLEGKCMVQRAVPNQLWKTEAKYHLSERNNSQMGAGEVL